MDNQVLADEVEFDQSAQACPVQISVPVKDRGAAIGAIAFVISADQVE